MPLRALIFDVDGTIADTERDGHLAACNDAFAALGYPIHWSWDEFRAMLHIPGNAQRMRLALARLEPPLSDAALDDAVARLVALKQRLYNETYAPQLPLRPGIRALISDAVARGVRLAIVSTSDENQIVALLRHHLAAAADCFNPVLGKGAGVKTAPDSPVYRRCIAELGLPPCECLVIEDSEVGLRAARVAGLPTAVFYNDYTFGQSFAGAALVARSAAFFTLDELAALCLPDGRGAGT
ncbi:MAG: HAD-IA family hydrolase [Anaerolineae bacterium]